MFISKVMTGNVVTIDKDADISQAQEKMSKHRFHHLPVVDEDHRLIGIVTDRDIRSVSPSSRLAQENIAEEWKRFSALKIEDIMTKNPVTISPLDTIQDALFLFHFQWWG